MPQQGSYGFIVFEHSANNVRSFCDMAITTSGRWATHEPISGRVVPQFAGPGQSEAVFDMHLHMRLGIDVPDMLRRIRELPRRGVVAPLIVGNEPIHDHDWLMEVMEEKQVRHDPRGRVVYAIITATLREYN